MKIHAINDFFQNLSLEHEIHAPVADGKEIYVRREKNYKNLDWTGKIPYNSYKHLFLPPREILFYYYKNKILPSDEKFPLTCAWAMNILDLQALLLYDTVFAQDEIYQKRRSKTLVVGFSAGLPEDYRKYKAFHENFHENILEHLHFDIFLERQKNKNFKVFSGSRKGQEILEKFNIQDYDHVEFAGNVKEEGQDPVMLKNKELVENGFSNKIWEDLGKIGLACGKCSLICPTCFCFDECEQPRKDKIEKYRQWGVCFYPEFSKINPGHKFLNNVSKKLYFWYYHKFVRIPEQYQIVGCVSCMRCYKVCPAKINIKQTLKKLAEGSKKKTS